MSRTAADLYHIAVHYNCSNKRHKLIPAAVEQVAVLYKSAVHYNCSNRQHKCIPNAVQTGSSSISRRSSLQLQ